MNYGKLKSYIAKKAKGNSDIFQKYYQMFYFERILERISKSIYWDKIILKGGLLLTSYMGDEERTTKDMDATIKGLILTEKEVEKIFEEILNIKLDDNISFKIISIKEIREEEYYKGYRLNILASLDNNKTYLKVELTTGDIITPREMKYSYKSIFEDKNIPIMSYNIETIIAEKFQTIISRGLLNTRMKDFYDIYYLINYKKDNIDYDVLNKAIINTFKKRNTSLDIIDEVLEEIAQDDGLKDLWATYASKNTYAKLISYNKLLTSLLKIQQR